MPSDIQPSANHKFVEMPSNGKVNLNSNPLDKIELIHRGLDINNVEKFRLELRWDIQEDSAKQVDFFLTSKFMEVFNSRVFEFSSVHVSQPSNHLVKYKTMPPYTSNLCHLLVQICQLILQTTPK